MQQRARSGNHSWRIPEWFPEIDDDKQDKLLAFCNELVAFNGRMNLISPRTEANADRIHIADAILGGQIVANSVDSKVIHDLGTGNGIPGIVMAILNPSIEIIGVDSDARKVEFLKHCAHRFKISNFQGVQHRIQDLPDDSIEVAVSRGLAQIPNLLLMLRTKMTQSGRIYHFKTERWSNELVSMPPQMVRFWASRQIEFYKLPETGTELTIVETYRK